MNRIFLAFAFAILSLTACKDAGKKTAGTESPTAADAESADAYFTFVLDGKEMSIDDDDISTSYNASDSSLRVFAGKDRQMSIMLLIPGAMKCPCTIPAGGPAGTAIDQGTVSLQNYPAAPLVFNSWYNGMGADAPADAIRIIGITPVKDQVRYISGEFHAKVLKTQSNGTGADNVDHDITNGKFKIKHETKGGEF